MGTQGLSELNKLVWNDITAIVDADDTYAYYKVPLILQHGLINKLNEHGYTVETNKDFPYHLRVTIKKGAV